mmetsp:Transcript_14484/g.25690  ORF Transcript_14484/g.25690 Transcript_14484/m.25690 type:complete len:584 (-) Transcript_14484:433-2184(-)
MTSDPMTDLQPAGGERVSPTSDLYQSQGSGTVSPGPSLSGDEAEVDGGSFDSACRGARDQGHWGEPPEAPCADVVEPAGPGPEPSTPLSSARPTAKDGEQVRPLPQGPPATKKGKKERKRRKVRRSPNNSSASGSSSSSSSEALSPPRQQSPRAVRPPAARQHAVDSLRGVACVCMVSWHMRSWLNMTPNVASWADNHYDLGDLATASFSDALLFAPCSWLPIPTFAICMGMGVAMATESKLRKGASRGEVARWMSERGLLLICIEVGRESVKSFKLTPYPNWQDWQYGQGAVFVLGAGMAVLGSALPLLTDKEGGITRPAQAVLASVGMGLLVGTHVIAAVAQHAVTDPALWPSGAWTAFPTTLGQYALRILALPGPCFWGTRYFTPFVLMPYVGFAFVGAAAAPELSRDPEKGYQLMGKAGTLCLAAFILGRGFGGALTNLRGPSREVCRGNRYLCRFFAMAKYPPELSYTFLFLGIAGVGLYGFSKVDLSSEEDPTTCPQAVKKEIMDALQAYGKAPLFFWLVQSLTLPTLSHIQALQGLPVFVGMPVLGLPFLYGMKHLCLKYAAFKNTRHPDSPWRML